MAEKKPLTEVLSIVGAALKPRGFTRTGSMLRIANDLGDIGLLQLQRSRMSDGPRLYYYVEMGVLPLAWADWVRTTGRARPDASDGLWTQRLSGPSAEQFEVTPRMSAEASAAYVLERLDAEPLMFELLDREVFLAKARRGGFTGMHRPELARLCLLLDFADDAAIDAELKELTRVPSPPGSLKFRFIAWGMAYRERQQAVRNDG